MAGKRYELNCLQTQYKHRRVQGIVTAQIHPERLLVRMHVVKIHHVRND